MGIAVNSHRSIAQHTRSIVNMKLLSLPLPWPPWPPLRPTMVADMAVMAMAAMVDTDMARGPLMLSPLLRPSPRLMPPQLPTTAMAALAATDTARGPLMPMPTTAMAAMADMEAMADTDTA